MLFPPALRLSLPGRGKDVPASAGSDRGETRKLLRLILLFVTNHLSWAALKVLRVIQEPMRQGNSIHQLQRRA